MKLHELKIKEEYMREVASGNKPFELRKNDRDFQVGDLIHFVVILTENDADKYQAVLCVHSNNDLYRITYVLKNVPEYGLDKDYAILGIKKIEISE